MSGRGETVHRQRAAPAWEQLDLVPFVEGGAFKNAQLQLAGQLLEIADRKSTRLNSSHALHDALPILVQQGCATGLRHFRACSAVPSGGSVSECQGVAKRYTASVLRQLGNSLTSCPSLKVARSRMRSFSSPASCSKSQIGRAHV